LAKGRSVKLGKREGEMTMATTRGFLLASASILALLGSGGAHAQMAVIDAPNLLNTTRAVIQGAQQVQQLAQQLQTMSQQLTQMQNIFSSVAHLPQSELTQLGQSLNVPSLRQFLPSTSGAIGSVMNGSGLGNMAGIGQQYLDQNHVYTPTGGSFNATAMTNNASSIAGVQAMADQLYQSASTHIATLQSLEAQLGSAPDDKAAADISARVQTEQTYIAAQQVEAQSIQTWQAAQVRNVDEQRREKRQQDIDDVINQASSQAGGSGG
jgi:type IV secretion system protein VirB5